MPIKILMPALSPTMTEGNLAKWHVKEGDPVQPGDVLAEIETDKATMELESVDEGVMGRIVVPEGAEGIAINEVIGLLLEEGEDASALDEAAAQKAAPAKPDEVAARPEQAEKKEEPARPPREAARAARDEPEPARAAEPARAEDAETAGDVRASPLARRMAGQAGIDIAGVEGSGPRGRIVRADVEAALGSSTEAGAARESRPAGNGGAAAARPAGGEGGRIFASPLARRMAQQAGLDLAAIAGSGPEGRIVKADIEAALRQAPGAPEAAARPAARPAEAPPPVTAREAEASEVVKLSTMRRIIAERMTESKTTAPHFYMTVDCEIDELLKVRAALNARPEREGEGKISVNDFVIRACALALREVPEANVSYEGEGMMRRYATVDISVAVAIKGGLITPIVRDADKKGLAQISAEMKDLAGRAHEGKLAPEEYQGGSFSISNLGMYGVRQFDAVINPPQAAILAVGAGEPRPVVRDGAIVPATVMSCTLSVDHRVLDGAIGANLLAAIKRFIEYPPAMLL